MVDMLLPVKSFYRLCPELHRQSRTTSGTLVRIQLLGQYPEWLAETPPVPSSSALTGSISTVAARRSW